MHSLSDQYQTKMSKNSPAQLKNRFMWRLKNNLTVGRCLFPTTPLCFPVVYRVFYFVLGHDFCGPFQSTQLSLFSTAPNRAGPFLLLLCEVHQAFMLTRCIYRVKHTKLQEYGN